MVWTMFSMKNLRSFLKRPDLHKGKLVGGFSLLLFALPTSAVLFLPPVVRFLGLNPTWSMLTGVLTSLFLVLGLTLAYAWVAYKTEESSESVANFFFNKSTKKD